MFQISINKENFKFKYLPGYAEFLLNHKLEEFVTVGIRFCRQFDLPMMKPLSKFSETELTQLSLNSNREMLSSLSKSTIADHIESKTRAWVDNKLEVIDQTEVTAEDLTLAFFIRRKTFANFLYTYSPNPTIHQLITEEVDFYTTQDELVNLKAYLYLHQKTLH